MSVKGKTSQDLREILFDTIEKVRSGEMRASEARAVSDLAEKVLDTVEAELRYSRECDRLDQSPTGISPGPLLLTGGRTDASDDDT